MAVSGTDSALASKLNSDVKAKLVAATGQPMMDDTFLQALCQAIAETVINHFVQNVTLMVDAGIPVATAGSPTAQTGATTAPGTGTIL
jgi:hypothetical protein